MPTFVVNQGFLNNGTLYKEGETIKVSIDEVEREKAKGNHPKTGKPISGLLNHCIDEDAVVEYKTPFSADAGATSEMIESIRAEFTLIGAAFDRRWGLKKLEDELRRAKKERGA
jgi:hypothetical protein